MFSNTWAQWNITCIRPCSSSEENQMHGWHICDVWRNLYGTLIIFYSEMLSCLAGRQPRLDKLPAISKMTFLDKGSCVLLLVSQNHPSNGIILPSAATNHSQLSRYLRGNCWFQVWHFWSLFGHFAPPDNWLKQNATSWDLNDRKWHKCVRSPVCMCWTNFSRFLYCELST